MDLTMDKTVELEADSTLNEIKAKRRITMEKLKEYKDLERAAHNSFTSIYSVYYNSYKFKVNNDVYNNYENNGKLFSLDISNNPLKYIKYETLKKLKRVYNNSIYRIDKEHYDNCKIYLKNYNTNLRLRIHNTPIMKQFRSFDELFEDCNEYIPAISN
jgi:predicted RND superfamily exporter protein